MNAICSNQSGTFTCSCKSGYNGNGIDCTDIDECRDSNVCGANAICANTAGSFTCSCNPGYDGDGFNCVDTDECSNETDTCNENATCTDTVGSFRCSCNSGYFGDGVRCFDVDECSAGTDNCDENATCSNTHGSFECSCNDGFNGNGLTCTDVNECSNSSVCDDNATCTNTDGSFTCSVEKTWDEAFPGYDPINYVDVDSFYSFTNSSGYFSLSADKMFNGKTSMDGLNFWGSLSPSGQWIKIRLPQSTLLSAVIITRIDDILTHNRYKNVCLNLDGGAYNVCTDASGPGDPYLVGNEIRFPIHPSRTSSEIELKWGNYPDNNAPVASLKFEMPTLAASSATPIDSTAGPTAGPTAGQSKKFKMNNE